MGYIKKSKLRKESSYISPREYDEIDRKRFGNIKSRPQVYLELTRVEGDTFHFDLKHFIVMYMIEKLDLSQWFQLNFVLVPTNADMGIELSIKSERLMEESQVRSPGGDWDLPEGIKTLICPSIVISEKNFIISGLTSTLRFILKYSIQKFKQGDQEKATSLTKLLGHKGICLQTCAETSTWTKFCEIDLLNSIQALINDIYSFWNDQSKNLELDLNLLRLESQLGQPVSTPNSQKLLRELKKASGSIKNSIITELAHDYAEGVALTLSDLILYPCVRIASIIYGTEVFTKHLALINLWLHRIESNPEVSLANTEINIALNPEVKLELARIIIPQDLPQNIYDSNGNNHPLGASFIRQEDIASALGVLANSNIIPMSFREPEKGLEFSWNDIPKSAHPEGGSLPEERQERKGDQLANLAQIVIKLVEEMSEKSKQKIRIVDFCSGGGHLGLLLAYLLPNTRLILVENNGDSLRRAEDRIESLSLKNVTLFQSNLDYFNSDFDIGVALHACGTATDLVMDKCYVSKAAFVICPCCYGKCRPNHLFTYPRSKLFSESGLSLQQYYNIGHSADQANLGSRKLEQGKVSMRIIDTDRLVLAKELGYEVYLTQIIPETASPKNHILVGVPCN